MATTSGSVCQQKCLREVTEAFNIMKLSQWIKPTKELRRRQNEATQPFNYADRTGNEGQQASGTVRRETRGRLQQVQHLDWACLKFHSHNETNLRIRVLFFTSDVCFRSAPLLPLAQEEERDEGQQGFLVILWTNVSWAASARPAHSGLRDL